jgi:hypothetical protein
MQLPSEIERLVAAPGPAELGPEPRPGTQGASEIVRAVASSGASDAQEELIEATLLLWHDHLGAAHEIAQRIESAEGSYVHGIMHRREPDYGNAKYWFRRVGRRDWFTELALRVSEFLKSEPEGAFASNLIVRGTWDPLVFVDLCEATARDGGRAPGAKLLRQIQQIEFEVLLDHVCRG